MEDIVKYPEWSFDFKEMSQDDRKAFYKKIAKELLDEKLFKNLMDGKKTEKIGVAPYIQYVPMGADNMNKVVHITPKEGVLFTKILGVPAFLIAGPSLPTDKKKMTGLGPNKISGVKIYGTWPVFMVKQAARKREEWKDFIIRQLELKAKGSKRVVDLVKAIKNPKMVEVLGFCHFNEYSRAWGDHGELEVNWLHALGNPVLFVRIIGTPLYMVVGPSISWGKSDLPSDVTNMTG